MSTASVGKNFNVIDDGVDSKALQRCVDEKRSDEATPDNKVDNTKNDNRTGKEADLIDANDVTAGVFCANENQTYFEELHLQPLSERWSPVGANYDDAISPTTELINAQSEVELFCEDSYDDKSVLLHDNPAELLRLRSMEEEQELLTSSLLALTSHFAHVQLRVRQIVEAPSHERDQLLRDLEEFAFRGIPEPSTTEEINNVSSYNDNEVAQQRQFELINHLKAQLSELEKIAYDSGAPVLPQHMLLEKQKIIIDELKHKLNLKVEDEDLPALSPEDLKSHVDSAFGEFVGPLKMKEQLVAQLKTQITDLERFIAYLQCDSDDSKMKTLSGDAKFNDAYNSYAAKKMGTASNKQLQQQQQQQLSTSTTSKHNLKDVVGVLDCAKVSSATADTCRGGGVRESLNSKAHGLMDKASLLMQIFATTQFGSKADEFQKNTLKKTSKGNHWGDLRAQLEVDIQEVASLAATLSFDREKLANIKCAIKKSSTFGVTSAWNSNKHMGALTTMPPCGRRFNISSTNHTKLMQYTLSSDSDDETFDCYDCDKKTNRRITRCGGDTVRTLCKELTTVVRKNFAMTLLRLAQHGLRIEMESASSSLIVPFMRCLNSSPVFVSEKKYDARDAASVSSFLTSAAYHAAADDIETERNASFFNSSGSRPMHGWELILEYYYMKHGDEYNNTPARKLSQSFNLDIVDSHVVTAKQSLLSAIGMIIALHRPYKRSYNAHFKAFVCAGLNSHQLVEWLNLIFSCSDLIDTYYMPNSYVARTGFRDSLHSIDALTKYDFDLPVDLAVRHFRNI